MTSGINTREMIMEILLQIDEEGEHSHIAIRNALSKYQFLPKQERAFITRVCEGTLEYRIYRNKKAPSQDRAFPAISQLSCDNAYVATTEGAFYFKLDHAFDFREQGVIFTHANAVASVELGAALTHDDVARNDNLAAIHLHAKAFGF